MFVACKLQGCFATLSTFELINVVMCVAFSDGPMEAYVARNEEPMQKQRREETKRITNVEIVWHGCWAKIHCGRQQLRHGPQIKIVQRAALDILGEGLQQQYAWSGFKGFAVHALFVLTISIYGPLELIDIPRGFFRSIRTSSVELDIQVNSLAQMATWKLA